MISRTFYTAARRLALVAVAFLWMAAAARAEENPVGDWDVNMDFNGNPVTVKIIITKGADGALAGKWSSPRGEADLSNVKYEAGKLSFVRKLNRQGQDFELPFEGKIEGDKLTGKITSPMGEMPVTGTRGAAGSKPAGDKPAGDKPMAAGKGGIVGTWNILSKSQLGDLKRKLIIKDDMKAVYDTGEAKYDVKNLKLDGDTLTYDVTVKVQDQDMALAFKGKVTGNKLVGKYSNDGSDVAEVTGEKAGGDAKEAKPAGPAGKGGIVGSWDVTSESGLGTLKRKLIVKDDMTGIYDTGEAKNPIKDLKVDGDKVTFTVTIDVQGNKLPLSFKGKVEGDNLTGNFTSEAGDATVTGKRMK